MESWVVGYDGDADVERHAGIQPQTPVGGERLRLRVVSDYI